MAIIIWIQYCLIVGLDWVIIIGLFSLRGKEIDLNGKFIIKYNGHD